MKNIDLIILRRQRERALAVISPPLKNPGLGGGRIKGTSSYTYSWLLAERPRRKNLTMLNQK